MPTLRPYKVLRSWFSVGWKQVYAGRKADDEEICLWMEVGGSEGDWV